MRGGEVLQGDERAGKAMCVLLSSNTRAFVFIPGAGLIGVL